MKYKKKKHAVHGEVKWFIRNIIDLQEEKYMPHAIIKLWPGRTEEQKKLLTERITKAIIETVDSEEKSVSISIVEVGKSEWGKEVYKKDIINCKDTLYKSPGYHMDVEEIDNNKAKFQNLCPVFISEDIKSTVKFYVEELGFMYANHYDKIENFATVYRDSIEFVIVQSRYGKIESNTKRYGVGYDAYIDPDSVADVDLIYQEYRTKNINILSEPHKTDYGTYEFVIEDIDGRLIGIGLIYDNKTYFKDSNYINGKT